MRNFTLYVIQYVMLVLSFWLLAYLLVGSNGWREQVQSLIGYSALSLAIWANVSKKDTQGDV